MAVDPAGRRFQDETAIKGPTRYAMWGRLHSGTSGAPGGADLDASGFRKIPAFALPPLQARSLAELASQLDTDTETLRQSAIESGRVAEPPFFAFPMCPGIAFHVSRR